MDDLSVNFKFSHLILPPPTDLPMKKERVRGRKPGWRLLPASSILLHMHALRRCFSRLESKLKMPNGFNFILYGISHWSHVNSSASILLVCLSYEVILTLDKEKHKVEGPIYYYVFNSLLFALLVLHIYWWVLIFRMLVKQIQSRGQIGDDVRSDSEGEDEHED